MVSSYRQAGTRRSNETSGRQRRQEGEGTMQSNSTSTLLTTGAQERRRSGIALGGAVLLLTAAVAIGVWQSAGQGERSGATTAPQSGVESTAGGVQPGAAAPRASDVTVYMVGSQAEAERLTGAIDDGNRILDQFGKPVLNAGVVVITSAAEEEAILRANADTDAIRAGTGLPPMKVIDLRGR